MQKLMMVVFVLACGLLSQPALSQCPTNLYSGNCTPADGGTCSTQIIKFTTGPVGIVLHYSQVWCCGTMISAPMTTGDTCNSTFLGNRDTLQRLAELSKTSTLLTASCDGFIRNLHLPVEDIGQLMSKERESITPPSK